MFAFDFWCGLLIFDIPVILLSRLVVPKYKFFDSNVHFSKPLQPLVGQLTTVLSLFFSMVTFF